MLRITRAFSIDYSQSPNSGWDIEVPPSSLLRETTAEPADLDEVQHKRIALARGLGSPPGLSLVGESVDTKRMKKSSCLMSSFELPPFLSPFSQRALERSDCPGGAAMAARRVA